MSVPKRRLVVTEPAQDDIRSITTFGVLTWGEAQAARYHTSLAETMIKLIDFPELGRPRTGDEAGIRSIVASGRVIYYEHDETTVTILRVLHRRMDPERHLAMSDEGGPT